MADVVEKLQSAERDLEGSHLQIDLIKDLLNLDVMSLRVATRDLASQVSLSRTCGCLLNLCNFFPSYMHVHHTTPLPSSVGSIDLIGCCLFEPLRCPCAYRLTI